MKYATLLNLADILMQHTDQDVTFDYTEGPIESLNEVVTADVQILVDGEVVGGWVNPQSAHDWLLGAVWGVQHKVAGQETHAPGRFMDWNEGALEITS